MPFLYIALNSCYFDLMRKRTQTKEYSGSGVLSVCRFSPDGGLLSIDNGVSSSTSLMEVVAVLEERTSCLRHVFGRTQGLSVDICKFANLGSEMLET